MTGDRTLRLNVVYCAVEAVTLMAFARPSADLTELPAAAVARAGLGVLACSAHTSPT
ncbi:hypothetical protein JOF29_005787 [Kribbella aluminosa]|uniref:Uncharacterized protein n=1 Tax=Kribbella aluminosa TaxID=416017 RepID=A0ABS4USS1_9ACTN|nr:hypothetical protein [Kribbella aluminosa]MBP2354677.1 hypothetical protein [Kribbella aluminosa]